MHTCGHTGHEANLIGAARLRTGMTNDLPGRIRLIFQPAEEIGIKSGAPILILRISGFW